MPTTTGHDYSLEPPAHRLVKLRGKFPRVVFISDIHCPFENVAALKIALKIIADFQPDLTVVGGDAHDNYLLSDHDKDPDRKDTLQDELDHMRRVLIKPISEMSPKNIYMIGNHEERTYRLVRREPALFGLRALSFKRMAELPDDWSVYQDQMHLKIGKLLYLHGNVKGRGGGARHIASNILDKLRTSSISGHDHRIDVAYATDYEGNVKGAYKNGHLSDVSKARYVTAPNWQESISLIEYDTKQVYYRVNQVLLHKDKGMYNGKLYTG